MILRRAGVLAVLALLIGSVWLPRAVAAPSSAATRTVVVVAIPGLLWSDVAAMPALDRLASTSAVGLLTVKTAGPTTRCAAGLLAINAGNRTSAPAVNGCAISLPSWAGLVASNRSSRYGSTLGLLSSTLQTRYVLRDPIGGLAVAMLADESGVVSDAFTNTVPPTTPAPSRLIGEVLDGLYAVTPDDRPAARRSVDQRLKTEVAGHSGAIVMVVGVSDSSSGPPNLHPIIISGPGWTHTQLRGSTGRAGYAQLIDVGPTILSLFDLPVPKAMVGRPIVATQSKAPSVASYVNQNKHAVGQRTLGQRTFLALGLAAILLMLLAWWGAPIPRRAATWLARLLAPAPALVFLGNAFPWWRWGQLSYAGVVLVMGIAVACVTGGVARRHPVASMVFAPALSLAILVLDQLDHSRLQFSAPLGDSPIVAGRFHGVGNLDFAVIATCAVVAAALVGARLGATRGAVVAGAILLVALAIDGAPRFGDDFGGLLTLVPAALVVLAGVLRVRVTGARIAGVVVAAVVVAVGVALADYSRPASSQTHIGRFVGEILHGGAWTEVHRKLDSMLGSFGLTVGTFVAAIALILAVINRRRIRAAVRQVVGLSAAATGLLVVAVLGVILNDSGITVAAMVVIVGFASIYSSGWYVAQPVSSGEPAGATGDVGNPGLGAPS